MRTRQLGRAGATPRKAPGNLFGRAIREDQLRLLSHLIGRLRGEFGKRDARAQKEKTSEFLLCPPSVALAMKQDKIVINLE